MQHAVEGRRNARRQYLDTCVHTWVYQHTRAHTPCTDAHTCMHVHAHASTCTHTHMHTHMRSHTRTHVRTHARTRARACTHSPQSTHAFHHGLAQHTCMHRTDGCAQANTHTLCAHAHTPALTPQASTAHVHAVEACQGAAQLARRVVHADAKSRSYTHTHTRACMNAPGHTCITRPHAQAPTQFTLRNTTHQSQAGAAHVYAVDASQGAAELARRVVRANGMENKITVIHGRAEAVALPVERVDVIMCDWMGPALLHDSLLPTLAAARDRCGLLGWLDG